MPFDPENRIVRLCLQGMALDDKGQRDDATRIYLEAWNASTSDFERFLAAYYLARVQERVSDQILWLETSLKFAAASDDACARTALGTLYANLAETHQDLGERERTATYREFAERSSRAPADVGPFYHGTRADLRVGDLLTPGRRSNYQSDVVMNHVYFTALVNGAALAAALAQGEGSERVYIVEPAGTFEDDPNVTNKKFPGNLTRSYRTSEPLKVIGELTEWTKRTPEEIRQWRKRLTTSKGEIIN